jgi:hypothetical protein
MQQAGSNLFPTLQQDLQEEEQDKLLLAEAQAVIASIEAEQRAQLYTKSPQVEPSPHRSMHSTKDDLFAYLDEILAGHSINDIEDVMKTASNIPEDALPTNIVGVVEYEDGLRYEGELDANDDWCGHGRFYFAEGDFYEGQVCLANGSAPTTVSSILTTAAINGLCHIGSQYWNAWHWNVGVCQWR